MHFAFLSLIGEIWSHFGRFGLPLHGWQVMASRGAPYGKPSNNLLNKIIIYVRCFN
jgi:hypothetical protein